MEYHSLVQLKRINMARLRIGRQISLMKPKKNQAILLTCRVWKSDVVICKNSSLPLGEDDGSKWEGNMFLLVDPIALCLPQSANQVDIDNFVRYIVAWNDFLTDDRNIFYITQECDQAYMPISIRLLSGMRPYIRNKRGSRSSNNT